MISQPTLTSHVTSISTGAHVVSASFLGRTPAFALGDGEIVLAGVGEETRLNAHPNAGILVAVADQDRLITGGDDGRVVETRPDGTMRELAHEKGKWIDALAMRADGAVAYAFGKQVRAMDAKGEVKTLTFPSTVQGLAFLPKGYRLAATHYNGVSLWFPNAAAEPEILEWKGSHLDVTVSEDARFIVTSMQENALHGWRVADKKNMRMTGYPAKSRSLSWSHDGEWLATSGAEACIVWPFQGKDGPMGKPPRECAVRPARVTAVAFHPKSLVVAVGFQDGWLLLVRLGDNSELLVRHTEIERESGAISALTWSADGRRLRVKHAGRCVLRCEHETKAGFSPSRTTPTLPTAAPAQGIAEPIFALLTNGPQRGGWMPSPTS